jgi:hypothetical protein
MKKILSYVSQASILGITCTLGLVSNANAMTIKPENDSTKLADAIVGEGIAVDPGSIKYTGAAGAAGFFDDGMGSGIGINNGIVLTTGQAIDAVGPNDNNSTTTTNGSEGNSDLDALIPGYSTTDASVLEFDFESEGGDLFFDFAFASEEYNEYVGSNYNDVFGFFLDGENIALIPNTDTPVAINNVNVDSHSGLYNNNESDAFNIEYDGFTDVFKAEALNLSPGNHTIKLAVADAGDSVLDSAVFIGANSFSDVENPDPDPDPDPNPDPDPDPNPDPNPDPDTAKTPEPASIFSLLALGLVGSRSLFKRKLSFRK